MLDLQGGCLMIGLKFLLAVIAVEAVAEVLTESRLTAALRRLPGAMGYFFGCGYCASLWLGVGSAYLLRLEGVLEPLGAMEPAVWGLVVHRASNVLHEAVSRFLGRVPWALFLNVRGAVPMDLQIPVDEPETTKVTVPIRVDLDPEVLSEAVSEAVRDADDEAGADVRSE